ncbi:MAG: 3'(2'),5'-bisphosphate nucleotidase CysQ [Desulfovibrio sp.]
MFSKPLQTHVDMLIPVAADAGRAILEIYSQAELAVEEKNDGSPLTKADLASHNVICQALEKLYPDTPVLSEESKAISADVRQGWGDYFLIDPLDGTKEFVNRNGEFTVNIALICNNRPVLGVVYAPVLDTFWYAAKGEGAFKRVGQEPSQQIHAPETDLSKTVKVVGSRSHASPKLLSFLEKFEKTEIIPMGSSLKLCCVADGSADMYPRMGLTSEWDIAAADIVVSEAGGEVVQFSGKPLEYNKTDLLNPFFIVFAPIQKQVRAKLLKKAEEVCSG